MNIKMIVTDLDNTLLHSDKTISEYTANVLTQCKKRGIKIAFATARPERAVKRFLSAFAPDYIISDNGATISCDGVDIYHLMIPPNIRDELITLFTTLKEVTYITVEVGHCLFTNYDGPPWEPGWNPVYTDFSHSIVLDSPKLSVECENLRFLNDTLKNFPDLHLYSNHGENWHQIMCKSATKTNAIAHIAHSLGFTVNEAAAFGDDYNDVEMLNSCGTGVAVSNAIDEVKAVAQFICDSNDNDGVAKWLEENLLNEK